MLGAYIPDLRIYSNNDFFSWDFYEKFPKTSGNTDMFFIAHNIVALRKFGAWHQKPDFQHYHTYQFRLKKAISENDLEEIPKILKNFKNFDQIIDDKYSYTALHQASALNRIQIIKYLIFRGFDINVQNSQGKTPIMIGLENQNFDSVKILSELGADLEIQDNHGFNIKDQAKNRNFNAFYQYLSQFQKENIIQNIEFKVQFDFYKEVNKRNFLYKFYKTQQFKNPFNNFQGKYQIILLENLQ